MRTYKDAYYSSAKILAVRYGFIVVMLLFPALSNSVPADLPAGPAMTSAEDCSAWGPADYDGDRLADPTQYDGNTGLWTVCLSSINYAAARFVFGGADYLPFAADYDGDGKADLGRYNIADGAFSIKLSRAGYAMASLTFAETNACPLAMDFDGDGLCDPAVYDPATGRWCLRLSSVNYGAATLSFGEAGYIPAAADFDGDRRADPALYHAPDGIWLVKLSSANYLTLAMRGFGGEEWTPTPDDYDGDARADPAIYREADGAWCFLLSRNSYAPLTITGFGGSGKNCVSGDYDGDRCADPAVHDPAAGTLSVRLSGGNYTAGSMRVTNVLQTSATAHAAAYVNEQSVAMLYATCGTNYDYGNMRFQVLSHTGTIITDEDVLYKGNALLGSFSATMVMDPDATPHIFFAIYGDEISHVYLTTSGWTNEVAGYDTNSMGGALTAARSPDGSLHLFRAAGTHDADDPQSLYAFCAYYTNKRGIWENTTVPVPKKWSQRLYGQDMAVDANGNVHICLSFQDCPSQDVYWPGSLYYLSNASGTWLLEKVSEQAPGNNDACFWNPSIAVTPGCEPAIAAHLRFNVMTGSDSLSELFFARRAGAGQWTTAILADTADGYFGSDGGHFTGIDPTLAFDRNGTAHIIFSDLASSHINGHESAVNGQVRYARGDSSGWRLTTLFRQSAAAQEGIYKKFLLLSEDGQGLDVIARLYPSSSVLQFSNYRRAFFEF